MFTLLLPTQNESISNMKNDLFIISLSTSRSGMITSGFAKKIKFSLTKLLTDVS